MQEQLDLLISFCEGAIPDKGEDSYCHSFSDRAGLLGVFDGCGGAGARTHAVFSGHTEAYMASRLCAGAFYDVFKAGISDDTEEMCRRFSQAALERLVRYTPPAQPGGFVMKGSLVRTLPTTAAVALVRNDGRLDVFWAGDSRVYLLDHCGLAQLTCDDTSVPDPMENLYEDGVLRNVFCSDRPVVLHCTTVTPQLPFVVLAATDGCFGYVSTPMEFDGMVTGALLAADTPEQWEQGLLRLVSSVAGDDHALCAAAFGYGSFEALKDSQRRRFAALKRDYLDVLAALPVKDREACFRLWERYRGGYMRFLEGENS